MLLEKVAQTCCLEIDKIIKEPLGGAHYDKEETFNLVKKEILSSFKRIQKLNTKERINNT